MNKKRTYRKKKQIEKKRSMENDGWSNDILPFCIAFDYLLLSVLLLLGIICMNYDECIYSFNCLLKFNSITHLFKLKLINLLHSDYFFFCKVLSTDTFVFPVSIHDVNSSMKHRFGKMNLHKKFLSILIEFIAFLLLTPPYA